MQPEQQPEAGSNVRCLLAAAGLPATEDEIARLAAEYPMQRAGMESLYAIPEARYASPALVFNALPAAAAWPEAGPEVSGPDGT